MGTDIFRSQSNNKSVPFSVLLHAAAPREAYFGNLERKQSEQLIFFHENQSAPFFPSDRLLNGKQFFKSALR
jgi:hypothetical protein